MFSKIAWLAALAASAAFAQGYPSKPIRIVSPYAPGGSTDVVGRLVAGKMAASLGQPVLVENRPGAAGAVGAEVVARSLPDGYTLLITSSAILSSIVFSSRNVPYDPLNDFTPITAAVTQPGMLLVNVNFPAASYRELSQYARANPGKLSYATTGVGSSFHFMGEIIKHADGINLIHVPYKGGAQAAQAVAAGEVQVALLSNSSGMAAVRSGKAKALAILGEKRMAELPDVPVIADFLPGVERPADWLGFYGPAGMGPALVARVHSEIVKALNSPDVVKSLRAGGMEVFGNSPEEFTALMRHDITLYRKMVPIAGIKLE